MTQFDPCPLRWRWLTAGSTVPRVFEACWAITNMAASVTEHTQQAINASPHLIGFLSSGNVLLQEQAAWGLGNMAADCPEARDLVLAQGVVMPILALLAVSTSEPFLDGMDPRWQRRSFPHSFAHPVACAPCDTTTMPFSPMSKPSCGKPRSAFPI